MSKKSGRLDESPAAESPFAALQTLRDALPPGPAPSAREAVAKQADPPKKGPPKAVVRLEKKGRGGKEVTLVEQLGLSPTELERWLKELKNQLGCGGALEGDVMVLQGDLRKRVAPLLEARGVRQVKVG